MVARRQAAEEQGRSLRLLPAADPLKLLLKVIDSGSRNDRQDNRKLQDRAEHDRRKERGANSADRAADCDEQIKPGKLILIFRTNGAEPGVQEGSAKEQQQDSRPELHDKHSGHIEIAGKEREQRRQEDKTSQDSPGGTQLLASSRKS